MMTIDRIPEILNDTLRDGEAVARGGAHPSMPDTGQ